jgi:aerobic carbon-monoxide dehydrogenase medium subunit
LTSAHCSGEIPAVLLREVEYARAENVGDAVRLLGQHEGARPLAGGQTLVNVMKARAASPDVLVDLNGIEELGGIRSTPDGGLELGAMATYTEIVDSAEVAELRTLLGEVTSTIADLQVRNRGTLGGNLCSNDPTNHLPPLMVAMDAAMTIAGAGGERTVAAEDFFLGVYLTAVEPGELLTKVSIPPQRGNDGFAALTIGREGTCIVSAAATTTNGEARLVIGCVSAVPVLLRPAADEDAAAQAVRDAALDPPGDVHAPPEYRRHLAEVLARRAMSQARGTI